MTALKIIAFYPAITSPIVDDHMVTDVLTVIAHGDSDGVCSAAVASAALRGDYSTIRVYFSHPADLVKDLKEFAKGDVIIVDIAVSESHTTELVEFMRLYGGQITYIDHHPGPLELNIKELPVRVFHEEGASASELTFRYFSKKLSREYSRVALYGAIADYLDQTAWVRNTLTMWDKRIIYFESGVLSQALEHSRKLHDFKRRVVAYLSENKLPSQDSELLVRAVQQAAQNEELLHWVEKNVEVEGAVAYVIDPPGSLGIAATLAKGLTGSLIGLAAERRGDTYIMSLRAVRGVVDLNRVLRLATRHLGGTGGGHPEAAGARIPAKALENLIVLLNKEVMAPRPARGTGPGQRP